MGRCRTQLWELARDVPVVPPGDPGLRAYETGPRGHTGRAVCAPAPDDVDGLRAALRWAYAHRVPLIPRGAGTGRAAAAVPGPSGDQAVLDLRGLTGDPEVDPETRTVTANAGVTLATLDAALAAHNLTLPFALLPARHGPPTPGRGFGARTVGGVIGDGVGGRRVVPGGSLRGALRGIAAVLADAPATPVPLADRGAAYGGPEASLLFTGVQGTLGVVTAARFAVVPRPVTTASAVLSFGDEAAALALFDALRRSAAGLLTGFELASSGFGARRGPHAFIRLADTSGDLPVPLGTLLTTLVTAHAGGADIAWLGDGEAEPPWPAPDDVVTELARSGTVVDLDVTVPPERVARLRAGTRALAAAVLPGARIADLGDALDGRWHLYVTWPSTRPEPDPARLGDLIARLYDLVVQAHLGTVAGAYAVGRDGTGYHLRVLPPAARRAVARVKSAFDPRDLLGTPRTHPPAGPVPAGRHGR